MTDTAVKLDKLRHEMQKRGVTGFFVPRADEFQGEYVPAANDRLHWITGFTGSAGACVVLMDRAGFFSDGRYTIQMQTQIDQRHIDIFSTAENQHPVKTSSALGWIDDHAKKGDRFGIDPWLHTPADVKRIDDTLQRIGAKLVLLGSNPLDAAWGSERPAMPDAPAVVHPLEYAGVASADKLTAITAVMKDKDADILVVTMPEDICWMLNIRGSDVPCTPFVLSYALVKRDGSVAWFVDPSKATDDVRNWIGSNVSIHPLADISAQVENEAASGKSIWVDPASAPFAIEHIVNNHGGRLISDKNPIPLMKAQKNETEIKGSIAAHIRDGVAMTRFLSAISGQGSAAKYDEMSASELLHHIRAEDPLFKDDSFDTISGAAGNGAIVHYRSTPDTNQPLLSGAVYLCDSGGQYLDGTTDITRTIAVDTPNDEMRENFTRVLKGHIAVATAVFPEGTTGHVIDAKAREALREVGLDYAHGTGHGVGSYLSVHEGPCNISPLAKTVPFLPGMILSNEPGFYKAGAYGIRIENLITVIDTGKKNAEGKKMLAFETLTLAPIDRNLIMPELMTTAERDWLNTYHASVCDTLLPLIEGKEPEAAAFLRLATRPI